MKYEKTKKDIKSDKGMKEDSKKDKKFDFKQMLKDKKKK